MGCTIERIRKCSFDVYKSSDGTWFVLVVTPDKVPVILKAMGREDILKDPRFSDPASWRRPPATDLNAR